MSNPIKPVLVEKAKSVRDNFLLGGVAVKPGSRQTIEIPVSVMPDHTPTKISVEVIHGKEPGPTVFVSAAIHGDEIIGVEIVRRLLASSKLKRLKGTLLAVPIVNSLGFINHSRYLPDRRDLNRSFPGSERGSLAGRLADIFLQDIVRVCDVGIDLHSAAIHRTNLPQIRMAPNNARLRELATAFAAPVTLTSPLREGSLRQAARSLGVDMLLFEAGEALRFDEKAIRVGVTGTLRVLSHLGMVHNKGLTRPRISQIRSTSSYWVRAGAGGLLRSYKTIGDTVEKGTILGAIGDPFGEIEVPVNATEPGLIIGRSNLPLVNEGDGLFHIARIRAVDEAESTLDQINAHLEGDPLFDEDEII
ncbi:MAG: succinylglutamate desuccinylase/aspartoacylase family protein [Burkholderiaceae bacterium]